MKYIDAEKLIAEIDKRLLLFEHGIPFSCWASCKKLVESLLQEQPDIIEHICLCAGIPAPFMDGNQWSILKGDNIQVGVVGFGDTKEEALINFIKDIPIRSEQLEVDLDFQVFAKEMDAVFNLPKEVTENTEENPLNWEYAIARHFYELGLNARKEE